jgi:dCMP deaminase
VSYVTISTVPRATTPKSDVPPRLDPRFLDRVRQVQWDHYYMDIARTVGTRANCTGSRVGAVLVADNRIISTGFNGTPSGFPNCLDGGCVRCRDRALAKAGRIDEMADKSLATGPKQLDICICVHAEANALLSAARAGTRTEGTALYSTYKPCFTCLKEAIQAGVERVVFLNDYVPSDKKSFVAQYELLAEHLRNNDARNFEQLQRQHDLLQGVDTPVRKPDLDADIPRKKGPGSFADGPDDGSREGDEGAGKRTSRSARTASAETTARTARSRRATNRPPKTQG